MLIRCRNTAFLFCGKGDTVEEASKKEYSTLYEKIKNINGIVSNADTFTLPKFPNYWIDIETGMLVNNETNIYVIDKMGLAKTKQFKQLCSSDTIITKDDYLAISWQQDSPEYWIKFVEALQLKEQIVFSKDIALQLFEYLITHKALYLYKKRERCCLVIDSKEYVDDSFLSCTLHYLSNCVMHFDKEIKTQYRNILLFSKANPCN